MRYGDTVQARYTPTTHDPEPPVRAGVVVCPDFGLDFIEVCFGTIEEYERLVKDGSFEQADDLTGLFHQSELTNA